MHSLGKENEASIYYVINKCLWSWSPDSEILTPNPVFLMTLFTHHDMIQCWSSPVIFLTTWGLFLESFWTQWPTNHFKLEIIAKGIETCSFPLTSYLISIRKWRSRWKKIRILGHHKGKIIWNRSRAKELWFRNSMLLY